MRVYDGLPAALVAVACTVGAIVLAAREPAGATRRATSFAQSPVLDGLRPGDRIAGWDVAAIEDTADGGVDVTMARDERQFVLTVVPLGARPHKPPFATATWAIYFGHAKPPRTEIPAGALRAITADLMRRIARGEAPAP